MAKKPVLEAVAARAERACETARERREAAAAKRKRRVWRPRERAVARGQSNGALWIARLQRAFHHGF